MKRLGVWFWLVVLATSLVGSQALAASLDKNGEISLGVRAYTSVRIGTQDLDRYGTNPTDQTVKTSSSFPYSPPGHVRQHRYFVEAELGHDLKRLLKEGFGPFTLAEYLPFDLSMFRYKLVYRGEGEGVYDYGPSEYRTAERFREEIGPVFGLKPNIYELRKHLRRLGVQRHRLFQAYVDAQVGDLFIRFGRQILAWGETDAFRVLDNINPLDSSFGGFLISLDERRVPLDMLRANYYLGAFGPISEAFVEGFVAVDKHVGWDPGVPAGSPWGLQNDSKPNPSLYRHKRRVHANFEDVRGGGQLRFNAPIPYLGEGTFGFAHYYTYLDTPAVQTFSRPGFPLSRQGNITQPVNYYADPAEYKVRSELSAPRVQVTGVTSTFTIPSHYARRLYLGGEPVIRLELAYLKNQPRFSQVNLDPFTYNVWDFTGSDSACKYGKVVDGPDGKECTGGRATGDSWNFVLGIDMNQYIRWLNPHNSFFFTTQFFYRHLNGAAARRPVPSASDPSIEIMNGEVLPVAEYVQEPFGGEIGRLGKVQNIFIHNPADQYLQTLVISTSYRSGTVNPSLTLFYDWSGAFVAAPSVVFIRDPFRFRMEFNFLEASRLKGASGVSLLRDRDNVLFQFEYVI